MHKHIKYLILAALLCLVLIDSQGLQLLLPVASAQNEQIASAQNEQISLKANEANLRAGPGLRYPIKGRYLQSMIPFLVAGKIGEWYKVVDFKDNEGWIHSSLLSKTKTTITIAETSKLYSRARDDSKTILVIKKDLPVYVDTCREYFCKITVPKFKANIIVQSKSADRGITFDSNQDLAVTVTGWIKKMNLWIP